MKRGKPSKSRGPVIGMVEWFRPGEYERVEAVLENLSALNIQELRTGICWADWYSSEGDGWYAWLLPRLARSVNILPCFFYTPAALGIVPKFSSPPQTPKAYADFIDVMITRFGEYFDWIELWNQPNNPSEWDSRMDPDWSIFSEMIGGAAFWAHQRGKKTVLPGTWPVDLRWLDLMQERGVLRYIDAVGIHGFPGTAEFPWRGWESEVGAVRQRLEKLGVHPSLWITQTGFSTWRGEESAQVRALADVLDAPVERIYWQSAQDRVPMAGDSCHSDERDYHYGLKRADGVPKLLFHLWCEGGLDAVRDAARPTPSRRTAQSRRGHVLITGGAGFIATNLAHRLLQSGRNVLVYDDLSRAGVENNLAWLRQEHGEHLQVEVADVRNAAALGAAVRHAEQVFHLAAQVAVTTSLTDPRHDFEVNVGGTLNLLEAIRSRETPPPLLFTSTNKVYGGLADLGLEKNCTRYQPLDAALRTGISEERPLDFHSPYGCSKGAADQYVLDYARTFGLPAVVFRMSCIYGPHQMGNEDQGWVAHFLIRAIEGKPIVLYGDGMQVRDLLFVEDLVDAILLAHANIHTLSGQAFNIGGGLGNTISLLELLELIGRLQGEKQSVLLKEWRPGDQRYYVSDTRKFKAATGWAPKVNVQAGVERLLHWLLESRGLPAPQLVGQEGLRALFAH
ncbi:MAG TPA: NAD-dependent epimerase/dehydratase family protein [Candidatus Sulfopaludibacter sp.]|jgi:CDP-paratose 2-epimerase|nr:NAD-dependent epimerase/dehydratase family protein [Candidatus Sulfopaludibacter sp.]